MQGKFRVGFVVGALVAANPAFAADSILDGPAPGPCAAALAGPDYIPGVDATGQPVARADIGTGRVPVPDQLLVPLPKSGPRTRPRFGRGARAGQGEPAYATIDGARLDRLVNPEPCPPPPPPPPRRR